MLKFTKSIILILALAIVMPNSLWAQEEQVLTVEENTVVEEPTKEDKKKKKKEKKEKKKKEKKPYVWEMPELSGDPMIDQYLLSCDTLWTHIQNYNEQITYYKVAQAETGEFDDTGKPIYSYMVIDDNGTPFKTGQVIGQYADWILSGTSIILECTTLSLMATNAALSLPNLGLGAFKYGKYVKGAAKMWELGAGEIKQMNASAKQQGAAIKALKEASVNTAENQDAVMKTSDVPEGIEIVQMTAEELDKKAAEAVGGEAEEGEVDYDSIFG